MADEKTRKLLYDDYPPQDHILRDLLISVEFEGDERSMVRAPVLPEVSTDQGTMQVGVIATLIDVLGAGLSVRAVYPDWIATVDLMLYTTGRAKSGTVIATGSILRAGQGMVFIEIDICEKSSDNPSNTISIGSAMMSLSRLPRRQETLTLDRDLTKTVNFAVEGSGLTQSLLGKAGITVLNKASGEVEMNMSDYLCNSFNALQGGVVALLSDAAGQYMARAATAKPLLTRDLAIHYLYPGKVGPFQTKTKLIRKTDNSALTRVNLIDRGANNRLIAVAMNTATLVESS